MTRPVAFANNSRPRLRRTPESIYSRCVEERRRCSYDCIISLLTHNTHMCNTHTLSFPHLSCPLSPPARSIFAQRASRARTQSHCRRFLGSGRRFAPRRRRRRRRRRQALLIAARSVGSHVSQSTATWRRRVSICFNAKWPAARLY